MTDNIETASEPGRVEVLKADILVERMKQEAPELGEALTDRQLTAIVRHAIQALSAELSEREEGRLRVPGFGRIQIRQVERERNGGIVWVKRISLRLAESRE